MSILSILTNCVWIILFAIYFKNTKHSFPTDGNCGYFSGICIKSALVSKQHWDFAQKFGVNLLFKIAGIVLALDIIFYILFVNLKTLLYLSNFLTGVLPIFAFYFILDSKLKKLEIEA